MAWYVIQFSVFYKIGSRLVKLKRNALVHTLTTNIQHPVVINRPHVDTRFAGASHLADTAVQIFFKINRPKHRTEYNRFVLDREFSEDWQPEISPILVFAGAAYEHALNR